MYSWLVCGSGYCQTRLERGALILQHVWHFCNSRNACDGRNAPIPNRIQIIVAGRTMTSGRRRYLCIRMLQYSRRTEKHIHKGIHVHSPESQTQKCSIVYYITMYYVLYTMYTMYILCITIYYVLYTMLFYVKLTRFFTLSSNNINGNFPVNEND